MFVDTSINYLSGIVFNCILYVARYSTFGFNPRLFEF